MTAAAAFVERWLRRLSTPRPEDLEYVKTLVKRHELPARALRLVRRKTVADRGYAERCNGPATAAESALLSAIADDIADAIWADFTGGE